MTALTPQAARAQLSADACAKRLGSLPCKGSPEEATLINVVAQAIRKADGQHTMGAGALAEVAVHAIADHPHTHLFIGGDVADRHDDEAVA